MLQYGALPTNYPDPDPDGVSVFSAYAIVAAQRRAARRRI